MLNHQRWEGTSEPGLGDATEGVAILEAEQLNPVRRA